MAHTRREKMMNAKSDSIYNDIDEVSKALSDALAKSGQPLGGWLSTDEDPLFQAMLIEAEPEKTSPGQS